MQVASCMSPEPVVVEPDASPEAALDLMDELDIRHLPVCTGDKLVGVVSDRDLLAATGRSIVGGEAGSRPGGKVEQWMRADPVTASPEDLIVSAAVEVIVRGIGCLPVLEGGDLVGIVTEMDLLRLYVTICSERELVGDLNPPVSSFATPEAIVVAPDAPWVDVLALGQSKFVRHFPVMRNGELCGIVSDRDLRRAQGAQLASETTVETLMKRPVQSVSATAPLSVAAERMLEYKISAMPVRFGHGIGMLSAHDVLDHATGVLR